jgi:hypothetical protein
MSLYLIDVHWQRRSPEAGRAQIGFSSYAMAGRTFSIAKSKVIRKFNRHFGMHLAVVKAVEKQDPAGIFGGSVGVPPASSSHGFELRDCGAFHPFGICPACGQGHGTVLMSAGTPSPALAKA